MLTCVRCRKTKPTSEFHRAKTRGTTGYRSSCKACTRDDDQARSSAYQRASAELRYRHADEFAELFEAEKKRYLDSRN